MYGLDAKKCKGTFFRWKETLVLVNGRISGHRGITQMFKKVRKCGVVKLKENGKRNLF